MDIFYYWKNIDADLKAGRLGRFRSAKEKLDRFRAGYPDFVWAFKTPRGRKGDLQLLAKLVWSDKPPPGFTPSSEESVLYYNADDTRSGRFLDEVTEAAIGQVSEWARKYFPAAVRANFVGENGQQELRGDALEVLNRITKGWPTQPLVPVRPAR